MKIISVLFLLALSTPAWSAFSPKDVHEFAIKSVNQGGAGMNEVQAKALANTIMGKIWNQPEYYFSSWQYAFRYSVRTIKEGGAAMSPEDGWQFAYEASNKIFDSTQSYVRRFDEAFGYAVRSVGDHGGGMSLDEAHNFADGAVRRTSETSQEYISRFNSAFQYAMHPVAEGGAGMDVAEGRQFAFTAVGRYEDYRHYIGRFDRALKTEVSSQVDPVEARRLAKVKAEASSTAFSKVMIAWCNRVLGQGK
jgi:hypothetical protein